MVKKLCDKGVRDEPDNDGNTPLHLAATCGNTEAVCMLLHLGMAAIVSAGIGGQSFDLVRAFGICAAWV
jgi:ankyrin repeat protein